MDNSYLIAVAGGSGSGKTFLAQSIYQRLGESVSCVISQDSYYIDQSGKFDEDGGKVNFDHPDAIDFDLLITHLQELKRGKSVDIPQYDFTTHSRSNKYSHQAAKKVILLDGILILTDERIRQIADECIFVDTPEQTRYERRLKRDVQTRGRTPGGVRAQFENQVKPMHDLFVEPSKGFAQRISSGTDKAEFDRTLIDVCNNIKTQFSNTLH